MCQAEKSRREDETHLGREKKVPLKKSDFLRHGVTEFGSHQHHLFTVWPWTSDLTPSSLSLLICELGVLILPRSLDCWRGTEMKYLNSCQRDGELCHSGLFGCDKLKITGAYTSRYLFLSPASLIQAMQGCCQVDSIKPSGTQAPSSSRVENSGQSSTYHTYCAGSRVKKGDKVGVKGHMPAAFKDSSQRDHMTLLLRLC